MSTITKIEGKTILTLDNGDMFAAKVTIDQDSKSRHFLKVEQRSHKGVMQTIIDRHGTTLLCSSLIDVLSECDDVVGQQLYEKLHKKYGKGTLVIDEILKVFNLETDGIGVNASPLINSGTGVTIHNILKKHKLL